MVVPENPIANLKVLYGTGRVRLNDKTGKAERVGGIKYTIKDGIVYDARKLLADVAQMVEKQKAERGITRLPDIAFPVPTSLTEASINDMPSRTLAGDLLTGVRDPGKRSDPRTWALVAEPLGCG